MIGVQGCKAEQKKKDLRVMPHSSVVSSRELVPLLRLNSQIEDLQRLSYEKVASRAVGLARKAPGAQAPFERA